MMEQESFKNSIFKFFDCPTPGWVLGTKIVIFGRNGFLPKSIFGKRLKMAFLWQK
jgi:hypothetical protein